MDSDPKAKALNFDDLRKEIIETRNQAIKVNNAVTNFSADLRSFQQRLDRYGRRQLINSVFTYFLFAGVIALGAYFASLERVETARQEAQAARAETERLRADAERLSQAQASAQRMERAAAESFRYLAAGQYQDALRVWEKADRTQLSDFQLQVMEDVTGKAREQLAAAALKRANEQMKARNVKAAEQEFQEVIRFQTSGPLAQEARLALTVSLNRRNQFREAAEHAERALQDGPKSALAPELLWELGQAYELLNDRAKAVEIFRRLRTQFATNPFANNAARALYRLTGSATGLGFKTPAAPGPETSNTETGTPATSPGSAAGGGD